MYVCICNAIKEQTAREAIRKGASDPDAIYHACGGEQECGKCEPRLLDLLAEETRQTEPELPLKDGEETV